MGETTSAKRSNRKRSSTKPNPPKLPLVIYLNCVEDCSLEQEALSSFAEVQHLGLVDLTRGQIEKAAAVVVQSLAFLPRSAQKRLSASQLVVCLGSADKQVDSGLAEELGLQLIHVDKPRSDEAADTAMALILGLLRHTHELAAQRCSRISWLGPNTSLQGMRRLRGMVLGLVGTDGSARALARRAAGFRMQVLFTRVEIQEDDEEVLGHLRRKALPAGEEVGSLEELLTQADVVSLHCPLVQETVRMINDDSLKCAKRGCILINTASCHLIDDASLKRALNTGALGGAALDGVEGPEWLEAWVREMPNVLITSRSADYSDEVWAEIRAKAVGALGRYLVEGVVPNDQSDQDYDSEDLELNPGLVSPNRERGPLEISVEQQLLRSPQCERHREPQGAQTAGGEGGGATEAKAKSNKRRKKGQRKGSLKIPPAEGPESMVTETSSADVSRRPSTESTVESDQPGVNDLQDGTVICLRDPSSHQLWIARRRVPGGGWSLEQGPPGVAVSDPAAHFLVVAKGAGRFGLRSAVADGRLLQANKKGELVFINHNFDAWESWTFDTDQSRLVNKRFNNVGLDVSLELVAALQETDGVVRWIPSLASLQL